MSKVINTMAAAWAAVKSYPHGVSLALNLAVILAARFGLHVTPDELVTIVSVSSAAVTAYTHKTMVSRSHLTGQLPATENLAQVPDQPYDSCAKQ